MDEPFLSPGKVVAEAYRILEQIGEGSMGSVFSAIDPSGDKVAVKVLHPRHVCNKQHLARFVREARVAAQLKSEHAVRVFDVGVLEGDVPYFVMELLAGQDMHKFRAAASEIPVARAAGYMLQACHAVAEAHAKDIVHRDLKPANLFLARGEDGRERIKVIDFGVAKLLRPMEGDSDVTATTVVLGTPAFMAPEQMRSSKVDQRADVWALGATMYWLVTGRVPFEGRSIVRIYESILRGPKPIGELGQDVPAALEQLIEQTLVWDPDDRIQSVTEFATKLAEVADDTVSSWWSSVLSSRIEQTEVMERFPFECLDDPTTHDFDGPAVPPHKIGVSLASDGPPTDGNHAATMGGVAGRRDERKRYGSRVALGLGALALAIGAYALGNAQRVTAAGPSGDPIRTSQPADQPVDQPVAGQSPSGAPSASTSAGAAPSAAQAAAPSSSAITPTVAGLDAPASATLVPRRPARPRNVTPRPPTKRPTLAPPKRPSKGDAVWDMP